MGFDPSFYTKPRIDMQAEPGLTDDEWKARFIAHLLEEGARAASDDFKAELPKWAADMAPEYVKDRLEYVSPEEAADTDISYWEYDE